MQKTLFILILSFQCFVSLTVAQQKLEKFESEIVKFEHEDSSTVYTPESIVFVGSSSIRMWKTLNADMAPMPVINRGFGGSTIPEVTYYADRIILPYQPKIIVFYCGENDLANDNAKSGRAVNNFKKFYHYMHEKLPDTKVFFISIKPSIIRSQYWPKMQKANSEILKFIEDKDNFYYVDVATSMCDKNGVVLQDIFLDDNLHMNEKGYEIWTRVLKPILEKHYTD